MRDIPHIMSAKPGYAELLGKGVEPRWKLLKTIATSPSREGLCKNTSKPECKKSATGREDTESIQDNPDAKSNSPRWPQDLIGKELPGLKESSTNVEVPEYARL